MQCKIYQVTKEDQEKHASIAGLKQQPTFSLHIFRGSIKTDVNNFDPLLTQPVDERPVPRCHVEGGTSDAAANIKNLEEVNVKLKGEYSPASTK